MTRHYRIQPDGQLVRAQWWMWLHPRWMWCRTREFIRPQRLWACGEQRWFWQRPSDADLERSAAWVLAGLEAAQRRLRDDPEEAL